MSFYIRVSLRETRYVSKMKIVMFSLRLWMMSLFIVVVLVFCIHLLIGLLLFLLFCVVSTSLPLPLITG